MSRFPIPETVLERHLAILGINGSGKTSVAKAVIAEPLLEAGQRIAVIDPTGVWWGLRLKADGKRPAFDVAIFGGPHGDLPLNAHSGKTVAEAIGTSATPVVLDTIAMTVRERSQFFTDFAETLLRTNKGPLNVIIDECHLFMPQGGAKSGGQVPDMLHAGNNLVSLGRSKGIRVTMITQRPAKLHKDSLTQALTLIAMQVVHPLDREAIEDWIKDNADKALSKEIVSSLGGLKPGEGWIWSPRIELLKRQQFDLPKTLDTSSGEDTDAALPAMNLDAIKAKLGKVADDLKANDPRTLRAENVRLAAELRKVTSAPAASKPVEKINTAALEAAARADGFAQGWTAADQGGFERGVRETMKSVKSALTGALAALQSPEYAALPPPKRICKPGANYAEAMRAPARTETRSTGFQKPASPVNRIPKSNGSGAVHLPPGESAILIAAAQFDGVDRDQLSVLTGYKRSSRDAYIARLLAKGFVEVSGRTVSVTPDGEAALPADYEPLPTGRDLQDYWRGRLPEGERRILEELIAGYPNAVARAALDDATGYKRSSRDAYIARMKAKRLVEITSDGVRASETLF